LSIQILASNARGCPKLSPGETLATRRVH
jgi:hypothetical protein